MLDCFTGSEGLHYVACAVRTLWVPIVTGRVPGRAYYELVRRGTRRAAAARWRAANHQYSGTPVRMMPSPVNTTTGCSRMALRTISRLAPQNTAGAAGYPQAENKRGA